MNSGAFGENFPYTNFHELNTDWLIKVAKEFLDKYTVLQETIDGGIEGISNASEEAIATLQETKDHILEILDQWYVEHTNDIHDELADALEELNNWADQHQNEITDALNNAIDRVSSYADEIISIIPSEYGMLSDTVRKYDSILNSGIYNIQTSDMESGFWAFSTKSDNPKRLRNVYLFPVYPGMKIRYTNPTMKIYFGVLPSVNASTYSQTSGWIDAGRINALYSITNTGFLTIMVESASNITPSNFDSTINIMNNNITFNKYAVPQDFTDADNVVTNSIYQIPTNRATGIQHLPKPVAGILITILYTSDAAFSYQIYLEFFGSDIYVRSLYNNSWSAWKAIDNYRTLGIYTGDLDDATEEGIITVSTVSIPTNYPVSFGNHAGIIHINRIDPNSDLYILQTAIDYATGEMLSRNKYGTEWGDWRPPVNIASSIFTNSGRLTEEDNLNDITTNTVMSVPTRAEPINYPAGITPSMVFTAKMFGANDYKMQFTLPFFSKLRSEPYRRFKGMFAREQIVNEWNEWAFYKLTPRNYTAKYYAFGDSVAYGYSSDHDHDQSPWNYPALVGDITGLDVHNMCDPAQGLIKDWTAPATTGNFPIIDTLNEMSQNGDFNNTALITVNWAYNDYNEYPSLNFGSPTDPIPESTTGITTFLGYYAKILSILQTLAPYAEIILITGYGTPYNSVGHKGDILFTYQMTFADGQKTTREVYNALEEMANNLGFYCINQAKGGAINRINANYIIGDNIHPTYDTYRVYGNYIASRIVSAFQNL